MRSDVKWQEMGQGTGIFRAGGIFKAIVKIVTLRWEAIGEC